MSQLFFYKLLFITEIIIAEAIFLYKLPRRKHFVIKLIASLLICYLATIFFPLPKGISYTWWYSSIMFLALFLLTLGGVFFLFDIKITNAIFIGITAYTIQHLSFEMFDLTSTLFSIGNASDMYAESDIFQAMTKEILINYLVSIEFFIINLIIGKVILSKKISRKEELKLKSVSLLFLGSIILLIDIILNAVSVYINEEYNKTYEIIFSVYNVLCCVLVFYIQVSLVKEKDNAIEIENMKVMLAQASRQYALQKENIELINMKCHDLRYQQKLIAEKGHIDPEDLNKINEAISIYDATVKTGNEVLDIILTEKSLLCRKNGIIITCMADGSNLNFIREGDLYALFGNIVDNAIEAVTKVSEKEKRNIGVNIRKVNQMVSIKVDNYFNGKIDFDDEGLPLTTKSNSDYHGFGMKSVEMIVEKYNGDLSIVVNDDIFRLSIMFPIPK